MPEVDFLDAFVVVAPVEAVELAVCPREVVDALKRREPAESAVRTEAIVEVERRSECCQTG